ncbi:hypothetical protein HMPREF6123_1926 [Oribacterium sinus F0268]|uniref:Uncharacterized protein n=1 Tax=Oribacterium sinus F0268 TaxID=585501 RepID=C2KZK7_9FIRM|nr:hypothetical protein HMPREF6123_1926 [Oribacterium sinus F0268]
MLNSLCRIFCAPTGVPRSSYRIFERVECIAATLLSSSRRRCFAAFLSPLRGLFSDSSISYLLHFYSSFFS